MLKRKKSRRKNRENVKEAEKADEANTNLQSGDLAEQIKNSAAGLYYISETDAEIIAFLGKQAAAVDKQTILSQTGSHADSPIEEKEFTEFFDRLTKIQDWFGDEEKQTTEKYIRLKEVLERNLRELKVFRIGKIQLNIYVVGLDAENRLLGIETKAVET